MCLLDGFAGLGFAGQYAAAFFLVLPEVGMRGLDWFVGDCRDGGEFGLHRGRFVHWCGGGVVAEF
jgi:hypothetical protein